MRRSECSDLGRRFGLALAALAAHVRGGSSLISTVAVAAVLLWVDAGYGNPAPRVGSFSRAPAVRANWSMGTAVSINVPPAPIFNDEISPGVFVQMPGPNNPDDPLQAPGSFGWDEDECYWNQSPFNGYYWRMFPTLYYQDKLPGSCQQVEVAQLPLYDLPDGLGPFATTPLGLPNYSITLKPIGGLDRIREIPLECSPTRDPVEAAARYRVELGGSSAGDWSGALFYVTALYDDSLFVVDLHGEVRSGHNYSCGSVSLKAYEPQFVLGSTDDWPNDLRFSNLVANPQYVRVGLRPGRSTRDAGRASVQLKVDVIRWRADPNPSVFNNTGDAFHYVRMGGPNVQVYSLELPPNWCEHPAPPSGEDVIPISMLPEGQREAAEFDGLGTSLINDLTAEFPSLKFGHNRFRVARTLSETLGLDAYWHSRFSCNDFVRINLFSVFVRRGGPAAVEFRTRPDGGRTARHRPLSGLRLLLPAAGRAVRAGRRQEAAARGGSARQWRAGAQLCLRRQR